MKRQAMQWEKIIANHIPNTGLIAKMYMEFTQFNSKNKH